MGKIFLNLKKPIVAIKWDKEKPLSQYGEIGRGVIEIKPQVSPCGETRYYFGEIELFDGCWFVQSERSGYHVMTMDEIKKRYEIM